MELTANSTMILTLFTLEILRKSLKSLKVLFNLPGASNNVLFEGKHRTSCVD